MRRIKGNRKILVKSMLRKTMPVKVIISKLLLELILFRTGTIVDDWNSTPSF